MSEEEQQQPTSPEIQSKLEELSVSDTLQVEEFVPDATPPSIDKGGFDPRAALTAAQLSALEQLRKKVQPDLNPEQNVWCSDMCYLRYLRARNWDLSKAEKMLRDTLKWREESGINTIRVSDVETQIQHGHLYTSTFDLLGRPTMLLRVHTKRDPHTKEQKLQFMIYSMERAVEMMDESKGIEKMVWLVDCKGYNLQYNGEVKFGLELLNTLQNHFPERLGLVIIFDAPFMFKGFWNCVYPFVDANTKKKFLFLDRGDKKTPEVLKQHFDLSKLERNYGGELDYEYNFKEYLTRELEAEAKRKSKLSAISPSTALPAH